ncbi:hypothetical protein PSECIP111951_01075 [Pseudoalteromonas holothuriae]|uniref:Uncharacterized protein n=1 Tax=Pseudoalteromonas holothuriae TaxID=2963714 RepID=A0A9W4VR90_9GAMM|nr:MULTISPECIES: hypothetical protein [unclassified Pseudoalteromonas]CAH9054620.1 hypothetical protein PSECIP111951_01075 [Pseudoalteromonas sp. CIP111951]CAH9057309.1 hypothetical protein PSECIP111854_01971 [Pseudoalteromonas sp. CIP111854]
MNKVIFLCALLIAGYSYGHNSQTIQLQQNNESCTKAQTVLLGKMTLFAGTFKYLRSEGSNVCNAFNAKLLGNVAEPMLDCGQFDDWRLAYDMGNKMCQSLRSNMINYSDSLSPQMKVFARFEGPFEFKGDRHHQQYNASMGVSLACYLCDQNR